MFILILFVVIACQKDEIQEERNTEEVTEEGDLSLSGKIINGNVYEFGGSAFKLQLIRGDVDVTAFNESYNYPEAQIFITEKGNLNFEFNGLQEGMYTLWVTKKRFKSRVHVVNLRRRTPVPVSILMEKGYTGFTGGVQILDEEGNDLSEIRVNRNSTMSVFFYLYNGKGTKDSFDFKYWSNEGYVGKSFIVDGEIVHLYSDWIKEIKPCKGILKPNEIRLIEVVIDPLVYVLREHSSCHVHINIDTGLEFNIVY